MLEVRASGVHIAAHRNVNNISGKKPLNIMDAKIKGFTVVCG